MTITNNSGLNPVGLIFMHNNNNQYHNIMFIKDIEDDGGESELG